MKIFSTKFYSSYHCTSVSVLFWYIRSSNSIHFLSVVGGAMNDWMLTQSWGVGTCSV